jgi:hypothetical protein
MVHKYISSLENDQMPTVTTPHPHWAVTPPAVRRSVPLASTLVDGA